MQEKQKENGKTISTCHNPPSAVSLSERDARQQAVFLALCCWICDFSICGRHIIQIVSLFGKMALAHFSSMLRLFLQQMRSLCRRVVCALGMENPWALVHATFVFCRPSLLPPRWTRAQELVGQFRRVQVMALTARKASISMSSMGQRIIKVSLLN